MRTLLLILFFLSSFISFGQTTWSNEVASLFYDKCAKCHNPNGIAPFSLVTYAEVSPMAGLIYDAVNQERMPPWPPNNNYQQYVHNRALDAVQKTTILDWLTNGFPEGTASATPPPPVFPSGSLLGAGDLELQIPTYMSKAQSGQDDYVCFSVPSGLTQTRTIKSIEIIPGNRSIVHHALIYVDPSGTSVTDSTSGTCSTPSSSSATLVTGYTPGATPMTLPTISPMKLGIPLPANSNIVFAMHYPDGSYGEFDSTKVIFHFYPPNEPGIREVYAAPVLENWSFFLPANQVKNVSATYPTSGTTNLDLSLLSVFPHMHLLGKSIKTYALDPLLDTIPLMDIPHWDFHWQDFYFFKNIQHVPPGSKFKATGTYDNTSANPHNPNSPPVLVLPGLNTTDEMFLVYFHFMNYQAGDENYDMQQLMTASLAEIPEENNGMTVYPNPSSGDFHLRFTEQADAENFSIRIYDTQGKIVREWTEVQNAQTWSWDGKLADGTECRKGVYYLSANVNGAFYSSRLIRF